MQLVNHFLRNGRRIALSLITTNLVVSLMSNFSWKSMCMTGTRSTNGRILELRLGPYDFWKRLRTYCGRRKSRDVQKNKLKEDLMQMTVMQTEARSLGSRGPDALRLSA